MLKSNVFFLLILFLSIFSCNSQPESFSLAPLAFEEKIKNSENVVILDVRTPEEFSNGFIKNAINIDYNNEGFESKINELDTSKTYFVYCLSGGRSGEAATLMRSKGFKKVYELQGGILAWKKDNLALTINSGPDKISLVDNSIQAFETLIDSNQKLLVDFYAPWCGPCRKMAPMMEALKTEYAGKVNILKINIDENEALANSLGIQHIPLFHYYVNGKLIWQKEGILTKKEIVAALEN